jgi:DNA-binding transcriptional ArsR family regulator
MDGALRALTDPTRRAILRLVHDDELAAGQVARHFPAMSRPAVSQHLRVLADAGLVAIRPSGNLRLYRWRPEGLRDVTAFLARLVMRTAQGPFPMETTYTWAPADGGATRMTLRNRGEPAGFAKILALFVAGAMRRANSKDLARLKSILEAS